MENLLQNLEEKIMALVSELETLRHDMHRVQQENALLKSEKNSQSRKLQDLIALMDAIDFNRDIATRPEQFQVVSARVEEAIA